MKTHGLALLLLFGFGATSPAAVIHVPGDQPTIQAGIDAAVDGDTVLVADGTGRGTGNRDLNFRGKAITLQSANGPRNCIIDAEGNLDYPRRCVWFSHGEGPGSVLRGFTLTGGYAGNMGGAVYFLGTSPTVTGNLITGNRGNRGCAFGFASGATPLIERNIFYDNDYFSMGYGGAMYSTDSSPRIVDNLFLENRTNGPGGAGYFWTGAPQIEGNRFVRNAAAFDEGNRSSPMAPRLEAGPLPVDAPTSGREQIGGALLFRELGSDALVRGNIFIENDADRGAAIYCVDADPRIIGNIFRDNVAPSGGAGISCTNSSPLIEGNRFTGNHAIWGAAIFCTQGSNPLITNCLLVSNRAEYTGGGVLTGYNSNPQIIGCTFALNKAVTYHGGAIDAHSGSDVVVRDCILWGNEAPSGSEISLGVETEASTLAISYSDVEGGQAGALVDPASTLTWGAGMIDSDPRFATAALSGFFLCQTAAGQAENSPCVDAGDPAGDLPAGSTRTDFVDDNGVPDMGYHLASTGRLVAGPGPGRDNPTLVRLFMPAEDAEPLASFSAYGVPRYGVNVSCGDLYGDGGAEIVTGAGPGDVFGPHVRGFLADGTPLPGVSFLAYGTSKWGVNVACGDIDGDGADEIVTGAGPGAVFGPHVRAFTNSGTPLPGVSFMAYGTNKWGVNATCGDIDGDSCDEIITGAGPGAVFGPHVRAWNVDGLTAAAIPGVSFFAYATHSWGVRVACGDIDGDGIDEIFTAPGPSPQFGAHIRGWKFDGAAVSPMAEVNFLPWGMETAAYGATIYGGPDLNRDGREELFIGAGPDPDAASLISVYRYDGSELIRWFGLGPFGGLTYGANVAAGWME